MPNLIRETQAIIDEVRKGYPSGTGELHRAVPILLARIEELERTLLPFASVARTEEPLAQYNVSGLVHVYLKDCVAAMHQLDPNQSALPRQDNFFNLPAE